MKEGVVVHFKEISNIIFGETEKELHRPKRGTRRKGWELNHGLPEYEAKYDPDSWPLELCVRVYITMGFIIRQKHYSKTLHFNN